MRIPGNALRQSHLSTYGAGGIELEPGHVQPGCPRLFRMKYVEHKVPEDVQRMELTYGLAVHQALYLMEEKAIGPDEALREAWHPGLDIARYEEALRDLRHTIEKGGILPLLSTIEVEVDLEVPLYEDEQFGPIGLAGRLDGVWVNANDLSTLYVGDYKTDRSPPSRSKLRSWTQGRHYALLAWRSLPRWFDDPSQVKQIKVLYEAVKWNTLEIEYTAEEIEAYAAWAEAVARRILRDKQGKPRLNPGCTWCGVRSTCPEWRKLPSVGSTLAERIAGVSLEEQVVMMDEAKSVKGKLDRMVKDVRSALEERIELDKKPFESEAVGKKWWLEEGTKREVDVRALHGVIGDDALDMANVTLGMLDEYIDDHPELRNQIERCIDSRPAGKLSLKEGKLE